MKLKTFIIIFIITIFKFNFVFAGIKVISVKGEAAYKLNKNWLPMKANMALKNGTKISTGVKSTVTLDINGNSVIIRQLSMMKIYESSISDKSSKTRIGLGRGSIRARVSRKKRIKTSFKVSTPIATSSVRGTEQEISHGPGMGTIIKVIEGEVIGENRNGLLRLLSRRQIFVQRLHRMRPRSILSHIRRLAIANISDRNLTDDERKALNVIGHDIFEGSPLEIMQRLTGSALVRLQMVWP